MKSDCGYELYWHGCYKGTYDLIHPDSYAHPAKMSPALCYRILQHLQELGLLKQGDTILDPMAGTGMTNICAGAMGYPSISIELEDKFVEFQKQNKQYVENKIYKSLDWQMIQGDSRKLSGLLQEKRLVSIFSPPYQDALGHPSLGSVNKDNWGKEGKDITKRRGLRGDYGETKGQVGNLKSVTSPPYADNQEKGSGFDWEKSGRTDRLKPSNKRHNVDGLNSGGYGQTDGQIGKLKDTPLKAITSPPYAESIRGGKSGIEWQDDWGKPSENRQPSQDISYSGNKNNIGNLSDKPFKSVMSPPYEGEDSTRIRGRKSDVERMKRKGMKVNPDSHSVTTMEFDYGVSEGQIGKEQLESYLEAMFKVYKEIAQVSDVLVVVVKNPTRQGKLRRLDLDTIKILELAGWNIHCQHRSLLFEELEQGTLFDGIKKQVKGRLSFFKRLSWQNGNPVASWEDCIFCVRKAWS